MTGGYEGMRADSEREDSAVSVCYDKVLGTENRRLALILSYPLGSWLLPYRGASVVSSHSFVSVPLLENYLVLRILIIEG